MTNLGVVLKWLPLLIVTQISLRTSVSTYYLSPAQGGSFFSWNSFVTLPISCNKNIYAQISRILGASGSVIIIRVLLEYKIQRWKTFYIFNIDINILVPFRFNCKLFINYVKSNLKIIENYSKFVLILLM